MKWWKDDSFVIVWHCLVVTSQFSLLADHLPPSLFAFQFKAYCPFTTASFSLVIFSIHFQVYHWWAGLLVFQCWTELKRSKGKIWVLLNIDHSPNPLLLCVLFALRWDCIKRRKGEYILQWTAVCFAYSKISRRKEKIGLGFSVSPSQTNFCTTRLKHLALELLLLYLGLDFSSASRWLWAAVERDKLLEGGVHLVFPPTWVCSHLNVRHLVGVFCPSFC